MPKPKELQLAMLGYWEGEKLVCCGAIAKSLKFVPLILKLLKVRGAFPVFFTTTLKGRLCELMTWAGKTSGVEGLGSGVIVACGAVADPFRVTTSVCGVVLLPTV